MPHLLFASPLLTDAQRVAQLSVVAFDPTGDPYADKIANMLRSPFERTIFLDSDTLIVDEIAHVLHVLERYEVAVAHSPGYRGLDDPDVPSAFYEFNTGVIAWRSSTRTRAFLESWLQTYLAWQDDRPFPRAGTTGREADQPAFRHCAWRSGLRVICLGAEYNLRVNHPATVVERVRVIHGRHGNAEALARRINQRQGARNYTPRQHQLSYRLGRRLLNRDR